MSTSSLPPVIDTTDGLYDPAFYRRVEIHDKWYQRPVIIGLGLNDLLKERWHAHYKQERPSELDANGEIDPIKYNAWWGRNSESKPIKLIFLNTILLREASSDAPTHEKLYPFFPPEAYIDLWDFFPKTSSDSTTEPQLSTSNTSDVGSSSQEVKG